MHESTRLDEHAGEDGVVDRDLVFPQWPAPSSVHGFVTTRAGGVSSGPFATFNLDLRAASEDPTEAAAVVANRRRLRARLPAEPRWLAQVHGNTVVEFGGCARDGIPAADAAVTRASNVVLAVLVADCMPVLFASTDGHAIGIAHAGWRGLAAGVLEKTVEAMHVQPSDLVAWLGPAIGPQSFEVGADVHDAFIANDARAEACFTAKSDAKWYADLYALAQLRLARCGVASVSGSGWCTMRDAQRFYSYRRERTTGRMAALLWRSG
ncbi:MAG TPA: peptidoglycan editing factor PgeF [Casimicrobiaceae bacterium]|nr:peptidoglycan editing factor PgeF [Casimicrobiaceae bacterium]